MKEGFLQYFWSQDYLTQIFSTIFEWVLNYHLLIMVYDENE